MNLDDRIYHQELGLSLLKNLKRLGYTEPGDIVNTKSGCFYGFKQPNTGDQILVSALGEFYYNGNSKFITQILRNSFIEIKNLEIV